MIGARFNENDVEVVAGHADPAYGVPHAATIEAIKLAGALEALPPRQLGVLAGLEHGRTIPF
jgi:L-cysteate sulfo-lyase